MKTLPFLLFFFALCFSLVADVRLFDTLLFYNELDMLELRLREHDKAVDYFVIVEGATSFTGKPKPLVFEQNKERFKPWENKIIYVVISDYPEGDAWSKEYYSRDYTLQFLKERCRPDDIILHSDCDEIIAQEVLLAYKQAPKQGAHSLQTDFYYYNCNWKKKCYWSWPFIATFEEVEAKGIKNLRFSWQTLPKIPRAGWHLGYFLTPEEIAKKIGAFSHTEYNTPRFTNLEWIQHAISTGVDLFARDPGEDCVPASPDDPLPHDIHILSEIYQRK